MRPRHVVVSGLMGSGKTTVGRRLARALGWPYRDSDADLEAATGMSARELAARDGIEALHRLELRHLLDALAADTPSVISAAASTIDEPDGRAALADPSITVIFLRIDPTVAAARVTKSHHRPSPEALAVQAERREPWFRQVATFEFDTAATRPAAIVRTVVERLQG
jgi:shikimate kinase